MTITVTDVAEQPETADGAVGDGNCRKHHQPGRELDRAGPERGPGADRLRAAVPQGSRHRLELDCPRAQRDAGDQRDDHAAGCVQRIPDPDTGAQRGDAQCLVAGTARARPGRPTARRPSRTTWRPAAWPRTRPRGRSVGALVAASDTNVGDTLSYSLEGTDAASFDIVSTSGQIQTKVGPRPRDRGQLLRDGQGGGRQRRQRHGPGDDHGDRRGRAAGDADRALGDGDRRKHHQPGCDLDRAGPERGPGADRLRAAVPQGPASGSWTAWTGTA